MLYMPREIKFRGKRIDNGEWVYGSLSMIDTRSQKIGNAHGVMFICEVQNVWSGEDDKKMCGYWIKVDPETVGQYTGLKDKNGKEIWEGDIIDYKRSGYVSGNWQGLFRIEWHPHHPCWHAVLVSSNDDECFDSWNLWPDIDYEVIGNVWENPELIK